MAHTPGQKETINYLCNGNYAGLIPAFSLKPITINAKTDLSCSRGQKIIY